MGRGPLVGLLACGTLVSCRQNFPGVDGPRQEHVAACTTMPQIVSWKKTKKSSLLFHRHRHFGMDLSCCCWRVLLWKNFVCFKPRLHPRLAAGATLMLVLINCGVGLRCSTASASLVHPWHMRLRCIRIVNSHLSLSTWFCHLSICKKCGYVLISAFIS